MSSYGTAFSQMQKSVQVCSTLLHYSTLFKVLLCGTVNCHSHHLPSVTDNSTFSQLSTPADHLLHPYSEDMSCCDDIEILNIVGVGEGAWLHNQKVLTSSQAKEEKDF